MNNKAVCLFSSAGIGELGIVNNNIDIILSNELLEDRHKLHETNYPNTFHVPRYMGCQRNDCFKISRIIR